MSIKIGPVYYQVVEIADLHDLTAKGEREDLLGDTDVRACEIRIEANMDDQTKRVTLWHEVLHLILVHAGHSEHDERHIEALGSGIVAVLDENPGIIDLYGREGRIDGSQANIRQ